MVALCCATCKLFFFAPARMQRPEATVAVARVGQQRETNWMPKLDALKMKFCVALFRMNVRFHNFFCGVHCARWHRHIAELAGFDQQREPAGMTKTLARF